MAGGRREVWQEPDLYLQHWNMRLSGNSTALPIGVPEFYNWSSLNLLQRSPWTEV